MTEKEFRRLSRAELIEIIYTLEHHVQELQQENEHLAKRLEERNFMVERAGSLVEISAQLNNLFEAAQATADEYLLMLKNTAQFKCTSQ